jgi:hypothetical protein
MKCKIKNSPKAGAASAHKRFRKALLVRPAGREGSGRHCHGQMVADALKPTLVRGPLTLVETHDDGHLAVSNRRLER